MDNPASPTISSKKITVTALSSHRKKRASPTTIVRNTLFLWFISFAVIATFVIIVYIAHLELQSELGSPKQYVRNRIEKYSGVNEVSCDMALCLRSEWSVVMVFIAYNVFCPPTLSTNRALSTFLWVTISSWWIFLFPGKRIRPSQVEVSRNTLTQSLINLPHPTITIHLKLLPLPPQWTPTSTARSHWRQKTLKTTS